MRIRSTLTALVIVGSLGACHKRSAPPPDNQQVETPTPVPAPETPVPAPEPKIAEPKPAAHKIKAAPKPTADEQMLDDADATGMTSHAAPDAAPADTAGNSQ